MMRQIFFLFMTIALTTSVANGQSIDKNQRIIAVDSVKFKLIQDQMVGCWKSESYQFKYDKERNLGCEYKSRVLSSAPIFNLKIEGNEIFMEWIELIGGGSKQKIIKIKNNKLIIKNENGNKVIYQKNINCS